MTSLHAFQKPTVQRQTLLKNGDGRHQRAESFDPPKNGDGRQRGFGRQGSAQRARGRKIERFCGVAEGPEVLFTLARPAE